MKSTTSSTSTSNTYIPPAPDPHEDPAGYLLSIHAVRKQSHLILEKARNNNLNHFDVDMGRLDSTADAVLGIMNRDYKGDYASIPPHGRLQHFEAGGVPRVEQMLKSWGAEIDDVERTRRLIDLTLVSVLLDAGAGPEWKYRSSSKPGSPPYRRSEGLAVASFEMFECGLFSGDDRQPYQVDKVGLRDLSVEAVRTAMQVSEQNPLDGLEGRTDVLLRLAHALDNTRYFGSNGRPGNMLDHLLTHPTTHRAATSAHTISLPTLWTLLTTTLTPIWPPSPRRNLGPHPLGDAFPCTTLPAFNPTLPHTLHTWPCYLPFHKLTQWLAYSLVDVISRFAPATTFAGTTLLTGLPEYRNGGLFIEMGVLRLKRHDEQRGRDAFFAAVEDGEVKRGNGALPLFDVDDDVIVEWRGVTVGLLDVLLEGVNRRLKGEGNARLEMAQLLEGGTWKAGREIAGVMRPGGGPPVLVRSDGTVF